MVNVNSSFNASLLSLDGEWGWWEGGAMEPADVKV